MDISLLSGFHSHRRLCVNEFDHRGYCGERLFYREGGRGRNGQANATTPRGRHRYDQINLNSELKIQNFKLLNNNNKFK